MNFHAPVIDISPYISGGAASYRARTAAAIDAGLSEFSVIQVIGHGIPQSVIDGLTSAMDEFFGLDPLTKRKLILHNGHNRGYTSPKTETISHSLGFQPPSGEHDYFEALNVGAAAPDYPHTRLTGHEYAESVWPEIPNFRARVDTYFNEAGRVARELTDILSDSLGLPHRRFSSVTDHSIDTMRLLNYTHGPGVTEHMRGMSEHTDFGMLSVLWADPIPGFQVVGNDGRWHDVVSAPGALVVMVGELLGRLTNDRWLPTLHRTKPPITEIGIERRRSAVYHHDGNSDATIAPIPSLITPGAAVAYDPITVGEHIAAKLAGTKRGVHYTAAQRTLARFPREN